jgi:hypothetical protein
MATLTEKIDSREWTTGDRPSVKMRYILDGTSDDLTARTLLLNSTPTSYDGLVRDECSLEPIFVDAASGQGKWDCTVRYVLRDIETEAAWSFDTGGGTQHITQSLDTVASYAPSGSTAPDFAGAIGVTHDSVEGVDIAVPVYQFSATRSLPEAVVTPAYRYTLFQLTGKVNDAAWEGYAAGEVLFLGASGAKRGSGDWEIAYRFAASENKTDLTVGDITGIGKKGWEYLWVRYADSEDETAKSIVKKPIAAYVEKVYEEADFTQLEI